MDLLPEECVSRILSFTTPGDICRFSLVSPTFRSVANLDTVWERFIPSDYEDIISKSVASPSPLALSFPSKKELFFCLCDPILIDGGNKSFALDKWSGKKCYMVGARELSMLWVESPLIWVWRPFADTRFSEVADLMEPVWLDICCKMDTRMLSPMTTYAAYFVFKITRHAYGIKFPTQVFVRLGREGDELVKCAYFDPSSRRLPPEGLRMNDEKFSVLPRVREDGWKEIELGEFFVNQGEDGEVEMCLLDPNSRGGMAGILIQGIDIRPKQE